MARKLKQARWSYAEDRRLLEVAKSSKSPEEIVRLMSRSPAAVYKMAIRLGVPLRPVELGLKAKGK
jgi:ferredoxin-like protein FixX